METIQNSVNLSEINNFGWVLLWGLDYFKFKALSEIQEARICAKGKVCIELCKCQGFNSSAW